MGIRPPSDAAVQHGHASSSEEFIFIHLHILKMRSGEGGRRKAQTLWTSTLEKRAKVNPVAETLPTDQKERGWGGEAMKVDGRGQEMKGQRGGKRDVWR